MGKFRKKPVVIEAVQWTIGGWQGGDWREVLSFADSGKITILADGTYALLIETLEGVMRADVGDWIIRGVKGEIYPCKPDIFAETYEEEK